MDKESFVIDSAKKYGIFGLLLLYFLYQDHTTRELDREDRKNNISIMKTLIEEVKSIDTRVTVLESKMNR